MKLQTRSLGAAITFLLLLLPRASGAQEEAKPPKSITELQEMLKTALENNRKLANHANQLSSTLTTVRSESDKLRAEIREAMAVRDKLFAQVVELTDKMHQLQGAMKVLKERNAQLLAQLSKAKSAVDEQIQVEGVVTALGQDGLLEVSIGSDDGVRVGTKLDVIRGGMYIGRVQVLKTDPDRAVAQSIPDLMNGQPKIRDRVFTVRQTKAPAEQPPREEAPTEEAPPAKAPTEEAPVESPPEDESHSRS
jgi:uncharacterized phage infection (PIP) family protein YhgE